jgi:hypothetical protein
MLDLETIFDPDRLAPPAQRSSPAPSPGITLADLPPEWHLAWDERAAIMEYVGGLPREQAEARALADIVRVMEREENRPRETRSQGNVTTGQQGQ